MHVSEELLEQHVLNPQSLSAEERRRVEEHLQTCPSCRAIHNYLRSYYAELVRTQSPAAEDLDSLLGSNFKDESSS